MIKLLQNIRSEGHHNYVAFFLTMSCNLKCQYCINLHENRERVGKLTRNYLTPEEWIQAANRLVLRDDLPLTLQGGEPTLYKGFYKIVDEVKKDIKMDLLTNMSFDVDEFIRNVPVWRFIREAPYAPIRVSYHPDQNDIDVLIEKTMKMQNSGFRVGIYGILHPDKAIKKHILEVQERCINAGIDFRTKEFLGKWKGKIYGNFKYGGSTCNNTYKYCECKTTELIVDTAGYVCRCHSDLYNGRSLAEHILDEDFAMKAIDRYRPCYYYGNCNPCDVKVKTNRYQIFGHTSVEIINVRDLKIEGTRELNSVTQASSL